MRNLSVRTNRLPPGPSGDFLGRRTIAEFRRNPLAFITRIAHTYGDIVQWPFGPFRVYMASHPDYVHQIFTQEADKFHKSQITKRALGPTIGNGLLLSDGDFWRRQRRLIQPAFHAHRIQAYGQIMAGYAARLLAEWGDGQSRDIHHDMMKLTLGIVVKALFDVDVGGDADRIGAAVTTLIEVSNRLGGQVFAPPEWLPTRDNRANRAVRRTLSDVTLGFIHARRATGEDKGDLLSMLLAALDEDTGSHMTDMQVIDESITLFAAGHETTANALTWAFYLLSQNPDAERALHDELARILAGRAAGVDDLPNLPFTEMVIKETMRVFPPVWITPRQAVQDVTVGGYVIPAGQVIMLSQWVSHHDQRFFADPDVFRPQRWAGGFEKSLPKGAYFPFGGGPRICIGNSFALMEARLLLATLAQHYRLALAPGHVVDTEPLITLRPRYGMRMVLSARWPAAPDARKMTP